MASYMLPQIIKNTSIIGGASIANIVINISKKKIAAMLLWKAEIGLIGVLTNLIEAATQIIGMGYSITGMQEITK